MRFFKRLIKLLGRKIKIVNNWARQDNSLQLHSGDDEIIQIWTCKVSRCKMAVSWMLTLLTLGFLRAIFYWHSFLHALWTCDSCETDEAEQILIKSEGIYYLRKIRTATRPEGLTLFCPGGSTLEVLSCKYFTFKKLIFVWHPALRMFHKIYAFDYEVPLSLIAAQKGLTTNEAKKRLAVFGPNEITVELKPVVVLLFQEVFSPFYFFQIFSVSVWYSESYVYYSTIIIVISVLSIAINVWQTRRNQRNLRDMMYSTGTASVLRDGEWKTTSTTVLVPGDIIMISDTGEMQCDAVLLRGSVIMNEAMLTGESVPTTKTALVSGSIQPSDRYDDKENAKQTLYCGTKILQTKHAKGDSVIAVVIRSGFMTTKGRIVRTIMYPKETEFELTRDLFRFVGLLCTVALFGFAYTIVMMVKRDNSVDKIIRRALDVITIVVPPALPAAITIGTIAAQSRLKKAKIFCTSPTTINAAGAINACCFDKTGTLTEDGLNLFGVIPSYNIENNLPTVQIPDLPQDGEMVQIMASCHSLTKLNDQLAGDPMDVILFTKTGWTLESSPTPTPQSSVESTPDISRKLSLQKSHESDHEKIAVRSPDCKTQIQLVHEYAFTSALRRMSVFVTVNRIQSPSEFEYFLFCKGAPETLQELCVPETIPAQFSHVLRSHAQCGFRMIALAYKRLEINSTQVSDILKMPRLDVEQELIFLGLVAFENRLKDQTTPNIAMLKDAWLRTVMVTGDNMLTAVSVAKECGILDDKRPIFTVEAEEINGDVKITVNADNSDMDKVLSSNYRKLSDALADEESGKRTKSLFRHRKLEPNYQLAVSGSSYAVITSKLPQLLPKLSATCDVYARMAPEQKIQLVTNLQQIGYIVSMCGDGANDCGALKAAHVGCSLSQAEASIASPFTSAVPDISCMPTLIREGRSCLVTTFGVVEYMCCYSLLQFLAVVIVYWIGTTLSDFQFLYSDLSLTTLFVLFFGYTHPSITLSKTLPPTRIVTLQSMLEIIIQMSLVLVFQVFAFEFVACQPWFFPFVFPGDENSFSSYQVTCVFFVAAFQQIVLCVVFSKSHPHRRSVLSNRGLTIALILAAAVTTILLLHPGEALAAFFVFKLPLPFKFRVLLIIVAALHFFLAMAMDMAVEYLVPLLQPHTPLRSKRQKYEEILHSSVAKNPNWLQKTADFSGPMAGCFYRNQAFSMTDEL